MFTSRAEFRLLLREDNADMRLTEHGRRLGLVGDERWQAFLEKRRRMEDLRDALQRERVVPDGTLALQIRQHAGEAISREINLVDLLRRPGIDLSLLRELIPALPVTAESIAQQLETDIKYEGYVARAADEIDRLRRHESIALPQDLDYAAIAGLSNELKQKLSAARPESLARAARIPGITPAALSILLVHVRRRLRA